MVGSHPWSRHTRSHDRRELEVHTRAAEEQPWTKATFGRGQEAVIAGAPALDVDALYDEASEPG